MNLIGDCMEFHHIVDRTQWSLVTLPQLQVKCASRPAELIETPSGMIHIFFKWKRGNF